MLEGLLGQVRALANAEGAGVLLVVDELGKLLQYVANEPGREDVYLLQKLAERFQGSGESPFYVLGLLHQGFHAYAEHLPSTTRNEWAKVAERYEEIVFDQPMAHAAGSRRRRLGRANREAQSCAAHRRVAPLPRPRRPWAGCVAAPAPPSTPLETAPRLSPSPDPVAAPRAVLLKVARAKQTHAVRLPAVIGALGLQSFAEKPAGPDVWYGLRSSATMLAPSSGIGSAATAINRSGCALRRPWTQPRISTLSRHGR